MPSSLRISDCLHHRIQLISVSSYEKPRRPTPIPKAPWNQKYKMLGASTTFTTAVSSVASANSDVFLTFRSTTQTRRRRCSTAADVSRKMVTTWPSAIAVANATTRSSDRMIYTSQMRTSDNRVCYNYPSMVGISRHTPFPANIILA